MQRHCNKNYHYHIILYLHNGGSTVNFDPIEAIVVARTGNLQQMPTVLVIDDEVGALTLVGIMLEKGGLDVLKAQNAHIALNILETKQPDLIILDIMMPGMDGIELCQVIRSDAMIAEIPIIILSARSDPESVQSGLAAGANDYIQKPVLHHDLLAKVQKTIQNTASHEKNGTIVS
jgi:CheY-like chemotaxis protein